MVAKDSDSGGEKKGRRRTDLRARRRAQVRGARGNALRGQRTAGTGRSTKYSPEVHQAIVSCLSRGATKKLACEIAGISHWTFTDWLNRGELGDEPFATLLADCQQAMAVIALGRIERISAAGDEDWRADAWLLERTHRDEFARTIRQELKVTEGVEGLAALIEEARVNNNDDGLTHE